MYKPDKKRFVKSFLKSMQDELLAKINDDQLPSNWDGFELRYWIANKFKQEDISYKMILESHVWKKRLRDCKKTIIERNL